MRVESARPADARSLASNMRARDIAEIWDGWAKEPYPAMLEALDASYYARTMFYELEPLCMWGLAPMIMLSGVARFWIFASAGIDRHPRSFARASIRERDRVLEHCSIATNLIDLGDTAAMRWMAWLGGEALAPHQKYGKRIFGQFVLRGNKGVRACRRA